MRILIVLGTSAGGTGRHVADLVRGLGQAGHEVSVAAPGRELAAFGLRDLGAGSHPLEVSDRPSHTDAIMLARLRELIRKERIDVVHAHGARVGALSVLALLGNRTPLVTTLHNAAPDSRLGSLVHAGLERVVARGSVIVLGVSRDIVTRQEQLGAGHAERAVIAAAPPGELHTDRFEVRASLGVQARTPLLVTIGRLARQKDLDVLVDAVARLQEKGVDVLSVIAGDGPLRRELEARIAERDAPVRLLGRREDVADLIAAADVVVSSARWEGQPVALQEALHAGAAIVATDAGGTADVVGDAAILVPVADPESLASAILDVVRHPSVKDRLRAAALRRSQELPDQDAATAAALATYQRALDLVGS